MKERSEKIRENECRRKKTHETFYWRSRCRNFDAPRERRELFVNSVRTSLVPVTGRLPVSAAVRHAHPHPETPHLHGFQSQLTGRVQLHTVALRAISHINETYCRHSDARTIPLLPRSSFFFFFAWPYFLCIL